MISRALIVLFLLAGAAHAVDVSPYILIGGRAKLRPYKVETSTFAGTVLWADTKEEKDAFVTQLSAAGHRVRVTPYAPRPDEVAVSTSVTFNNFTDFRRTLNEKPYLLKKIEAETSESLKALMSVLAARM